MAIAYNQASIDYIRAADTTATVQAATATVQAATASVPVTSTTPAAVLPAKWEAAIRKMMNTFLEIPSEEVYQMIAGEVLKLKVHIDELFANSSEEKKDKFVEKVMKDIGTVMSTKRRSRVPAKFRIANVVIGDIIDNFGSFQPKKIPQDVMTQLKQFSEKLTLVCQQDTKCKKML